MKSRFIEKKLIHDVQNESNGFLTNSSLRSRSGVDGCA